MLVPAEPGRRNRRTVDGVLVATAAVVVGLAAVVARSAAGTDEEIGQALATLFGWAPGLWRAVLLVTLALAVVIAVDALVRRRWLLVRDLVIALLLVNAAGSVLARIVDSQWLQVELDPLSYWGFPELRIACVVAVIAVARPELVRPVAVAAIYFGINLSVTGVIPWREFVPANTTQPVSDFVVSIFVERILGPKAASVFTLLILWTAFGSVFALLLGYSRIPFAAAVKGDFFRVFARVHPTKNFPDVSLYVLGAVAIVASFFTLPAFGQQQFPSGRPVVRKPAHVLLCTAPDVHQRTAVDNRAARRVPARPAHR